MEMKPAGSFGIILHNPHMRRIQILLHHTGISISLLAMGVLAAFSLRAFYSANMNSSER